MYIFLKIEMYYLHSTSRWKQVSVIWFIVSLNNKILKIYLQLARIHQEVISLVYHSQSLRRIRLMTDTKFLDRNCSVKKKKMK